MDGIPELSEAALQLDIRLAVWKVARRDYSAAQRRIWQTSLLLGPLSFVGLGMLAGSQCPVPMDYLSLGGASTAMLLLWTYVGERCLTQRQHAGEELRAAESALGQRPVPLSRSATRTPDTRPRPVWSRRRR